MNNVHKVCHFSHFLYSTMCTLALGLSCLLSIGYTKALFAGVKWLENEGGHLSLMLSLKYVDL
jgi:hypothetical protein